MDVPRNRMLVTMVTSSYSTNNGVHVEVVDIASGASTGKISKRSGETTYKSRFVRDGTTAACAAEE